MKLNDKKDFNPLFNYLLVRVVDINPYANRYTSSGLVLASGSMAMSEETGQLERLEERIKFGVVMEVGPSVEQIQIGDEVYFDTNSAYPVPILDLGFRRVNERNVIGMVRGEGDAIAAAFELEKQLQAELEMSRTKSSLEGAGIII